MIRAVIAAADQGLAQQIQSSVLEMSDAEVAAIATTSDELTEAILRDDADVALVHEALGPEPVLGVMRDLNVRRPAIAMLLVAADADADLVTSAMEAGARGLVSLPLSFEQVDLRVRAAAAWSQQVRRMLAAGPAGFAYEDSGRGRVVVVGGAKGGVGVTTIATHLSLDVARSVTSLRICLVDLDLEKGDVPGLVEVRHRIGISDLAKVADDLSPGTVADAVTRHESGVDFLLAPVDVRDVEAVTPQALRQVISALRQEYDLVLIDGGSHTTPAQATAVELADEIVLVVTPDVAAMRGMRRTINAWESLGVVKESDVRVLVNRVSKQVTVSPDTIRQLTKATVLPVGLQAGYRRLEPSLNTRHPLDVRHPSWWADLRRVGREIGLVPPEHASSRRTASPAPRGRRALQPAPPNGRDVADVVSETPRRGTPSPVPAVTNPEPADADYVGTAAADADPAGARPNGGHRRPSRRTLRREARFIGEDGSAAIESLAMVPLVAVLAAIVWYLGVYGVTAALQANAADAASRAVAIGEDPQSAAEQAVPDRLARGVSVSSGGGSVTVTLDVAGILPGVPLLPGLPRDVTTSRDVVREPR